MAKATALARARRVRQHPKPKPQSAQIGPDGPQHPGNRQLYDKRGRPDAGARLYADYPNPKVATFCAALWLTFTLPLTNAPRRTDTPITMGRSTTRKRDATGTGVMMAVSPRMPRTLKMFEPTILPIAMSD